MDETTQTPSIRPPSAPKLAADITNQLCDAYAHPAYIGPLVRAGLLEKVSPLCVDRVQYYTPANGLTWDECIAACSSWLLMGGLRADKTRELEEEFSRAAREALEPYIRRAI